MEFSIPTVRILTLIAFLVAVQACLAQSSSSTTTGSASSSSSSSSAATATATATASASVYPDTTKWEYVGCQNETTLRNNTNGLRALNSGVSESLELMTVDTCLTYCAGGNYAFAGLEYTKECYCSQLLSALSAKLPESSCNLPCAGNGSQVCGGSLALTVYKAKSSKEGTGFTVRQPLSSSVLALGIALGVLLCLA
ncbi:putative fungistatic metabolite [Lachnellula hyalina]|uniref:Putative fungistatic metabolite n=1 Tax=Lachnellula hyalina TaxID=1316788 RepID=A0A8H8R5Z9_9HELO|nr:putative fungistatic metabolite [Lachnellula hyalina]TVY28973.1 putative fungistatic metabolite [Lachnellula hyalina]